MSTNVVFNPFDRSWWGEPYALYRQLLNDAPTGQVPMVGIRYFAGYDDCIAVFRDTRFGVDERKSNLYRQFVAKTNPQRGDDAIRSFLFLDPPDHTRLRAYVARAFTPRVVERLRDNIASTAESLLDRCLQIDQFDAITDLAYPLPLSVICELLGIPDSDRDQFHAWSKHLVAALDPELVIAPEDLAFREHAIGELRAYMATLISQRRDKPADGLVSSLANDRAGRDEAGAMSEDELISTLVLLLVAGYETTVNLIGNALVALARHPEQRARLVEEPSLLPAAIEEVLRYDPPVQLTSRVALSDATIGDTAFLAGDLVILLLAAANRDHRHFERPDDFEITRTDSKHLSFSFGAHHCLGASLARSEAQIAISEVLARFPDYQIGEPRYRDTLVLRGIESLTLHTHA